jgi:putative transposase
MRWCSDTLSFKCWYGEEVEIAFALDTCDREVMSWIASCSAITREMIRDLIAESVEKRFGSVLKLPKPVQWLSDNGDPYIAYDTRVFAESLGFIMRNTPAYSQQSNGMSEALVKTIKRNYANLSDLYDAQTVPTQIDEWFQDYYENAPHKGLKMLSINEYRRSLNLN